MPFFLDRWLQPSGSDVFRAKELTIDLQRFTCGQSKLGEIIAADDSFAEVVIKNEIYADSKHGIEVGAAIRRLEYVVVAIDRFPGRFAMAGAPVNMGADTTESKIVSLFGAPYWIDRSDGEIILLYEYFEDAVELQFEFSDGKHLSWLCMARNGVLSEEKQRVAYGVTRSLPRQKSRRSALEGVMPIWLHLALETVICFAGIALWWALMIVWFPFHAIDGTMQNAGMRSVVHLLVMGLGFGVGFLLSSWFRRFPARCRKCGDKAFARGNRPLRYVCQTCGHTEITNVHCNWGRR